jgi:hypothetical protein
LAIKIITAFKESSVYQEQHVIRLSEQVKKYSGLDLEVIRNSPYKHWWIKLSCFQIEGPCVFMDLDTTIVDDISPLLKVAEEKRFVGLRDFNYNDRFQSSIMSWSGDMSHIHDDFAEDPEGHMQAYPGGQQFVGEGGYSPEYWQDLIPNRIHSYKNYVRNRGIHKKCCVVAFHGSPRPWAIDELVKGQPVTSRGFRGNRVRG